MDEPRVNRMPLGPWAAAVLALMPIVALAVGAAVAWASGAHWVAVHYDPDYHYLLNSLNVAEGHSPRHTDHPGTPLQELGAGVLLARHAVTGDGGSTRYQVLRDPESALTAISVCLRVLHALALFLLGVRVRQLTGSLACSVMAQAATLLSMVSLLSLWRVSPEPLVMTLGLLLGCATLRSLRGGASDRQTVTAGALLGLGIATKVTFAPLALVPLAGLTTRRRWTLFAAAAAGMFAMALAPIWSQAGRLVKWFWGLFVGDGVYGKSRGHLIVDPTLYVREFGRMVAEEPAGLAGVVLSVALLGHLTWSGRWKSLSPEARTIAWTLALTAAAEFAQYVVVAKHAGDRYLVPALTMLGLNVALGYVLLREVYTAPARRCFMIAVVLVAAAYGASLGVRLDRRLTDQRRESVARMALHEEALRTIGSDGVLACAYGSSSPVFAMVFADWWTGGRYGVDLREMYIGQWNYNVWGKTYSVGARQLPKTVAAEHAAQSRLWFQGPRDSLPVDFDYDEIRTAGDEGLYKARPHKP